MTSLQGLSPGPSGRRVVLAATVIAPAPVLPTDPLYVVVPSLGNQRWGPCAFTPHDTDLPVAGARCVIVIDDRDRAWVAGWENGPAIPTPNVTIRGLLTFTGHGTIETDVDAADFARDGRSFYRRLHQLTSSVNGSSGARGDSISSSLSNSDGSFAIIDQWMLQHDTRGSMQGPTVLGAINEVGAGGVYHEMGLYEAQLTINSQGCYGALFEGALIVNAGKQARAAGHVILVQDANTRASYTMLDSIWNDTGSRGIWLASTGANPAGTAIFIQNDFERGIYAQFGDQSKYLLYSKQAGASAPFLTLNGLGTLAWNNAAGTSPISLTPGASSTLTLGGSLVASVDLTGQRDLTITRNSILNGTLVVGGAVNLNSTLGVAGNAQVSGQLALGGSLANGVAANETTSATAGTNPMPALVVGYLTFIDHAGTSRKIPYFAT